MEFLHAFPAEMQNVRNEELVRPKGDVIHSGHFMISSVTDDQEDLEDTIDHDRDSPVHHEQSIMIKHGYDFSKVAMETKDTYQFGPSHSNRITIDASLSRLFQCMSLAYRGGKVVSPKWKNFKGMKLTVKDKIRLNNAIWRTWHIQYVMMKKKSQSLIQFVTPLEAEGEADSHKRPEAVVMEGKYWKRRIENVVAEYKKWRAFFMEKCYHSQKQLSVDSPDASKKYSDDQQYFPDFSTDTLFSSLSQQPIQFPNPREIALHATNSDMIQPGLLQLQPTIDDFPDFDPLQDFFNTKKNGSNLFGTSSDFNNDPFMSSDLPQMFGLTNVPVTTPSTYSDQSLHNFIGNNQVSVGQPSTRPNQDHLFLPIQHRATSQSVELGEMEVTNAQVFVQSTYKPAPVQHPAFQQPQAERNLPKVQMMGANAEMQSSHQPATIYPHSKQGLNNPNDRIIYTQTQMPMQLDFLPQGSFAQKVPTPPSGKNDALIQHHVQTFLQDNGGSKVSMKKVDRGEEEKMQPTATNVFLLKQLLTTKRSQGKGRQILPDERQTIEKTARKSEGKFTPARTQAYPPTQATNQNSSMDVFMEQAANEVTIMERTSADSELPNMLQRSGSFSAEQKRRFNIKSGFNRLLKYLPNSNAQMNTKISKASLMNKATQYIKSLQSDRSKVAEEIQTLKNEIEELKSQICSCQQQLPASGVPVSRPHVEESKNMFQLWTKQRTLQDWKFYIFGVIVEPWFDSYQCMVTVRGSTDFCRSIFDWVEQNLSLPVLRPSVVQSLQVLCTTTPILTQPSHLRRQIEEKAKEQS